MTQMFSSLLSFACAHGIREVSFEIFSFCPPTLLLLLPYLVPQKQLWHTAIDSDKGPLWYFFRLPLKKSTWQLTPLAPPKSLYSCSLRKICPDQPASLQGPSHCTADTYTKRNFPIWETDVHFAIWGLSSTHSANNFAIGLICQGWFSEGNPTLHTELQPWAKTSNHGQNKRGFCFVITRRFSWKGRRAWLGSGHGGKKPSFLFFSAHNLCARDQPDSFTSVLT